jgi:D-2-hydroxyacid dehydrogenase (NADP+)
MALPALPLDGELKILFSHAAYQLGERFAARGLGIKHSQVRSVDALEAAISEADVVCLSMHWRNPFLAKAPKLRFVQSVSAGIDQYDRSAFTSQGVRLASAAGVNANAVAEHAMALLLALTRQVATGRDHQSKQHWRPMHGVIADREEELAGKTIVIVGLGRIGQRLARFAKAFDMRVIGVRRSSADAKVDGVDSVVGPDHFYAALREADVVALACALTPETTNLMDAAALGTMKRSAYLINVARGKVVDEAALIAALQAKNLAGAGLDVTAEEPLPAPSPLWSMSNVVLTPHTAGETRAYEDRVIDLLIENVRRLQRGETALVNQVV